MTTTPDVGHEVPMTPPAELGDVRPSVREVYASSKPMVALLLIVGIAYGVAAGLLFDVGVLTRVVTGMFAATLPLLAWTDIKTFRLPNKIVGPAALVLTVGVLGDVLLGHLSFSVVALALAVGLGLGVMFLVLAVVSGGGLGMGDVKFVTLAASVVALQNGMDAGIAMLVIPPALAIVGLLPVLVKFVVIRGRDEGSTAMFGKYKFAYGPYLIAGAILGLLLPAGSLEGFFLN